MKSVLITCGIIIVVTVLTAINVYSFYGHEESKKINFYISSCDEAFNYSTDAWVLINSIKTDIEDNDIKRKCDKALENIGRSKDSIVRAREAIESRK